MDTPSNDQPTIGRPFDVQAKGGLRLTCAFYADCAHEGSKGSEGGGGGFAADYKKGGAAGTTGCVEGLCPHRGNDSL